MFILTQVINGLIEQQKAYRKNKEYFEADKTQTRIKELIAIRKGEARKRKSLQNT